MKPWELFTLCHLTTHQLLHTKAASHCMTFDAVLQFAVNLSLRVWRAARLTKAPIAQLVCVFVGKEYEARLRQQHAKLNPKTSWARMDRKKAKKRRGFGEDSDEE